MSFNAGLWRIAGIGLVGVAVVSCRNASAPAHAGPRSPATVASFLTEANTKLLHLGPEASQAGWVQETYITKDTEAISARANEAYTNVATSYAKQAARFGLTEGSPEERRQLVV